MKPKLLQSLDVCLTPATIALSPIIATPAVVDSGASVIHTLPAPSGKHFTRLRAVKQP